MVPHLDATGIGRVTLPDKRESLNKIVAYRCIVFLRNVAPSSATIHLFLLSNRLLRRLLFR